jgi:hypothetical protein
MYDVTTDIKAHAGQGEVCIVPEPSIVPTVACVNTCPSARKQEAKRKAMQRFVTLVSVMGGSVQPH